MVNNGYAKVVSKESSSSTLIRRTHSSTSLLGKSSSQNLLIDPPARAKPHALKDNSTSPFTVLHKKPPIPKNKRFVNCSNQQRKNLVPNNRNKSVGTPKPDRWSNDQTVNHSNKFDDNYEVIELFRRKPNRKARENTLKREKSNVLFRENSLPNLPSLQNTAIGNQFHGLELAPKYSSHTSLQEYYKHVDSQHRLQTARAKTRGITPGRRILSSTISREEFHFIPAKQKEATTWKSVPCQTANTSEKTRKSDNFSYFPNNINLPPGFEQAKTPGKQVDYNTYFRSIGTASESPNILDDEFDNNLPNILRAFSRGTSLLSRGRNQEFKYFDSAVQSNRSRSIIRPGLRSRGNQQSRYLSDVEWRISYGLNIYVFRNGVANESPLMIHIPPNRRKNMASIFEVISERIKYPVGYIFAIFTVDGSQVFHPAELEMNHFYVVASNLDKQFKPVQYGKIRSPLTYLSKSTKHARGQSLNEDVNWCFRKKEIVRNEEVFQNYFGINEQHDDRLRVDTENVLRNLDWKTKYDINRNYEVLENIIPPPTAFAD